ncbi:MAG: hypothetical protein HQL97_10885 [Magnetococcales bacterium]|nr:hypothetical protein [Magnetococcales bacterium]MBF0262324.1 hypothetical protein [Magnetococcales bacterium]
MSANSPMILKTLTICRELFVAAPHLKERLGPARFEAELKPHLCRIREGLLPGPNPDFGVSVVDALEWGFHTPLQPLLDGIIQSQGFDWRFVTGRRRRFKELAPDYPEPLPPVVRNLWAEALASAERVLAPGD